MQNTKFIDITRSFIPVDPKAYPNNYHGTGYEDNPEDASKVVPYEGHNFLPTAYGYKSYFGIANTVNVDALASRVDYIGIVQGIDLSTRFVALCEDGIWVKAATSIGAWTQAVVLTYDTASPKQWSYCVINNDFYCYRQGDPSYYKIAAAPSVSLINAFQPTTGQPTVEFQAMAAGFPAGTYAWAVATKNASGWYSAPSAWSADVVFAAAGSAAITFNPDAAATTNEYRIYRKDVATGVITYFDTVAYIKGTARIVYDAKESITVTTLPDASWLKKPGVVWHNPQAIAPNFLNMSGQIGIFAAGIRLGFWDSANSIAWSSIDDFKDFTPSLETLAGSAIFGSVQGKIVTINAQGDGFIIYATKNVVRVKQLVEATFQWQPEEIINSGISYPREVTIAVPDTKQFVRTSSGIYKIEDNRVEVILPEFEDYLKPMKVPVYLQMLEGRYLCFQILDQNFINGQVQFTVDTVPASTVTFLSDAEVTPLGEAINLSGSASCAYFAGMNEGAGTQGEADTNRTNQGKPAKKPGTRYKPVWDAYFSYGHAMDADQIVWTNAPCSPNFNMSPSGNTGKVARATQDAVNKLYIPNSTFDTLSFYQAQLAIWAMEDEKRKAFLQAVLSRYQSSDTILATTLWDDPKKPAVPIEGISNPANVNPYVTGPQSLSSCFIGDYIADVSQPLWGINSCSFWVYRYITKMVKVTAWETLQEVAVTTAPYGNLDGWYNAECRGADAALYAWPFSDPVSAIKREYEILQSRGSSTQVQDYKYVPTSSYGGDTWWLQYQGGGGWTWIPHQFSSYFRSAKFDKVTKRTAFNRGTFEVGIFGVDVGWLQLVGWTYTDVANAQQTVAKSVACVRPAITATTSNPPKPSEAPAKVPPISSSDGSICGKPYTPVNLPAISPTPIKWTTQSVTLPPSVFLLQNGSNAPIYPTFYGAFVFDTHLKKWGKLKQNYKQLLDYLPVNHSQGSVVPVASESMLSGLLDEGGKLHLFDDVPLDSYITYGKIGYYRQGFTDCEEVKVQFKKPGNGFIEVQGSLDGASLEASVIAIKKVSSEMSGQVLANLSARWYNVTVRGHYDIKYLEFRGRKAARR